ncbi:LacI family transcriptional regulator [Alkalihalobacillus oceani]|uniref:LacI family transcriptional regulator n=1 Tax=Halalkalibacter oceani TaxID=1653776 RepID=A0A9X2DS99_9BACI|nr:LacI family DNA-binding transcriptional regulator [Halalkalibacter oceani]MCM3716109.1 LacI family transcriptional regulator [Halalkalibacter oceani]
MDRVTSKDVAKKAGVSQATVSRVINNYPHMKQSTREKVLKAIQELGFTPDQIARSLNMRKTSSIGLIVGDISNPFFAETAKVIISQARKSGFDVILTDTEHESVNLEKSIESLVGKRVEGIIIGSVDLYDSKTRQFAETGFPVVFYNTNIHEDIGNYVVLNNKKGAKVGVKHLVELGHRKIAYISGTLKYSNLSGRLEGFKEALKEYDLPFDKHLIKEFDVSSNGISTFLKAQMEQPNPPTAFFAASDQIAFTVMEAARELGLQIPDDISVIGFDNINISANPFINLTTISQQHRRMASIALENLLTLIKNDNEMIRNVLEPELILRSTTTTPRK